MVARSRGAADAPPREQTLEKTRDEWIRESCRLLSTIRDELKPSTGNLGREMGRELLLIHVRKGMGLVADLEPEQNPADALREAVAWYELLEEQGRKKPESRSTFVSRDAPRWIRWAYRLLPSVGLSRWARLSLEAYDANEREILA